MGSPDRGCGLFFFPGFHGTRDRRNYAQVLAAETARDQDRPGRLKPVAMGLC